MKLFAFRWLWFLFTFLLAACQESSPKPLYKSMFRQDLKVVVDGELREKIWEGAYWEKSFRFPWRTMEAPATEFCSVTSDDLLYFAYTVIYDGIVFASGPMGEERGVAKGDRVEIFFAVDDALKEYYCLEISPKGRVLDYRASHYRQFDHS